MKTRRLIGLMTCACALPSAKLQAQNISATLNVIEHTNYATIASQFKLTDLHVDGELMYAGSAYLICADYPGLSLDQDSSTYTRPITNLTMGSMDDVEIWNRFSTPQDQAMAQATIHWFVDTYYESHILATGSGRDRRQYAFGNVVWEIFGDGATSNGLNFYNGNITNGSRFSSSGSTPNSSLWTEMTTLLASVNTAVSNGTITTSYAPSNYVYVALDPRSDHQDYLMLAENPSLMVVPEPRSAFLGLVGCMLLIRRRR